MKREIRVKCIKCRRKNTIMKKVLKKKKKENFISKIQNVLYRKKLQQDSIQIKALKDIVEEKKQRNLKKTFKILKKVWLNIRVKKVNIYKSITVKVLLNSGIIEMFIDKEIVAKHRFRLQKLKKLLMVRNINGTYNSKKAIIHQMKINIYYKNYIKRIKMYMCNLEKTDIILEMPQL